MQVFWTLLVISSEIHTARVHVINLRHRRDRLATIVDRLSNASLPPTWDMDVHRVDAVTPRGTQGLQAYPHWRMQSLHDQYGRFWSRPVTHGELACFASHMRALHSVINEPAAMSMVLEDDATFDPATFIGKALETQRAVQLADPRWDVIMLGYVNMDNRTRNTGMGYSTLGYTYQTHAYLVSPAGARKIAEERDWRRDVTAFDEYLAGASGDHPRADINDLYGRHLRRYGATEQLASQARTDNWHDTEL
jgi:GR25 family glycosyltransferase involved in LPS biosynthesis